jgi:hypothetical protein
MPEAIICLIVLILFGVRWLKDSASRGTRYQPPAHEAYRYYDVLEYDDDRDGRDVR